MPSKKNLYQEDSFDQEILNIYQDCKTIVELENKLQYLKKDVAVRVRHILQRDKTEEENRKILDIKGLIKDLFEIFTLPFSKKKQLQKILDKLV